jgi:2-isopropylmalate synthase
MVDQVRTLAWEIANSRLPVSPNCAARTLVRDIEPIAQISPETGLALEAATFIGSSPIRQYAEDWTLDRMLRVSEEAVTFAVRQGLPVMYVTEDTTRARPETLKALYGNAIRWGARRLCLADTTGHATPSGVRNLVFRSGRDHFAIREDVKLTGMATGIGARHRELPGGDRGRGGPRARHRPGVGERVGNTEMDLLIVNLRLLGLYTHDVSRLPEYCRLAAEATGVPIPVNYPVVGADAFRTGTGVHAAAIVKARKKGDAWLADRVYSSVPAGEFGLNQRIDISPQSGVSNVKCWLEEHGYDPEDSRTVDALFQAAKRSAHTLADEECHRLVEAARMGAVDAGH